MHEVNASNKYLIGHVRSASFVILMSFDLLHVVNTAARSDHNKLAESEKKRQLDRHSLESNFYDDELYLSSLIRLVVVTNIISYSPRRSE